MRHLRFDGRFAITPAMDSNQPQARATRVGGDLDRSCHIDAPRDERHVQAEPQSNADPNIGHRHDAHSREFERGMCIDLAESGKPGSLRCGARILSMELLQRTETIIYAAIAG
jgi:hypothetical protein